MVVTVAIDCNLLTCIIHNSLALKKYVDHINFSSECFLIHAIHRKYTPIKSNWAFLLLLFFIVWNCFELHQNDSLLIIEIQVNWKSQKNAFIAMDWYATRNLSTGIDNGGKNVHTMHNKTRKMNLFQIVISINLSCNQIQCMHFIQNELLIPNVKRLLVLAMQLVIRKTNEWRKKNRNWESSFIFNQNEALLAHKKP